MEWGATLLLAGITWVDGVARVAPASLVLRRAIGGAWSAAVAAGDTPRWTVVASWRPLTAGLVVAPPEERESDGAMMARDTDARLANRLSRAEPFVTALRLLGVLTLVALLLGVPWAAGRFGALGLLLGCGVTLLLSLWTACVAAGAFRVLGRGRLASLGASVGFVSPFAAPRAADAVLSAALGDAPQELVARRLLAPAAFEALIRPRAYDVLRPSPNIGLPGNDDGARRLAGLLGADYLSAIVSATPADCRSEEAFCARCGAVYRSATATCADCGGLELVRPAASTATVTTITADGA